MNSFKRIIKIATVAVLIACMIVSLAPAKSVFADEASEITFWSEEEFTGDSVTVNLDTVKAGDALPAFASGFRNWEIRTDGSMDLVFATRPGQKWTQEMIDALKAAQGAGLKLNGLPSKFNITESNVSWPAANAQAIVSAAGKISKYIMYFIFDSDRTNADFDVLEVDIRSIAAGDALPKAAEEKNAWKIMTSSGKNITASSASSWSQEMIDAVKKAVEEGSGVAATDFRYTEGFLDVTDPSQSIYKPIYWASEAGIVSGYSDGRFGPDDNCTRAQFAIMLWRMNGKPSAAEGAKKFSDVKSSGTIYKAISWASGEGIVNGYNDGTFGPDNNLTRRQIVIMIWRFLGKPEPSAKASFSDVKSSESSYKAISWASGEGLVKGYGDGSFKPDDNCTRAQIVIILYRAVKAGLLSVN